MYLDIVRLSSKGQLVIPGHVRKRIGLRPGSKLALFANTENILLKLILSPDISAFHQIATEANKMAQQAKAKRNVTPRRAGGGTSGPSAGNVSYAKWPAGETHSARWRRVDIPRGQRQIY